MAYLERNADILRIIQSSYWGQRVDLTTDAWHADRGMEDRPFFDNHGTPRIKPGYKTVLPTFKDLNVEQLIGKLTETKDGPVRILDVGCGNGRFLLDCYKRWENKVSLEGITAFKYRDLRDGNLSYEEICEYYGIYIQEGDAQRLDEYYQPNNFDLVVSTYALIHMVDSWGTIQRCNDLLTADGIALFDFARYKHDERLKNYLIQQGLEITRDLEARSPQLAFQKKPDGITLPLEYVLIGEPGIPGIADRFEYRFLEDPIPNELCVSV